MACAGRVQGGDCPAFGRVQGDFLSMGEGKSVQINVPFFEHVKVKYFSMKSKSEIKELSKIKV